MKFDLYIELASRTQDLSALELLRFPAVDQLLGGGLWAAKWWAHGRTRTMRSTDRESILANIATEGCNELQITWKAPERFMEEPTITAVKRYVFNPSPTCDLWAAVPEGKLRSRSDERSRRSFLGGSLIQTRGFRLPYPSIFECTLEIKVSQEGLTDIQLQDISVEMIRSRMPENLIRQDIFGYGCVHGTCRRRLMTVSMGGVPAWMDQLGGKFENIYPILIGPRASCDGMANALAGRGEVRVVSDGSPSAILSIHPDDVNSVCKDGAVREWLVERPPIPHPLGPRVYVVPPKKE